MTRPVPHIDETWFDPLRRKLEALKPILNQPPFEKIRILVTTPDRVANRDVVPLISHSIDTTHDPASLAKLMTFYLAMQDSKEMASKGVLPPPITIGAHADSYGNRINILKLGDTIPWDEGMAAMIIASDNKAATQVAVMRGQGATDKEKHRSFVDRMNSTARLFNMSSTHFANASGMPLDPKKHPGRDPIDTPSETNAKDIAKLIAAIYRDFPAEAQRFLEPNQVTYHKQTKAAYHTLSTPTSLGYVGPNIRVGSKGGFTDRAQSNLVTMATGADGQQLIIVVLGVPIRSSTELVRKLVGEGNLPKPVQGGNIHGFDLYSALTKEIIQYLDPSKLRSRALETLPNLPALTHSQTDFSPDQLGTITPSNQNSDIKSQINIR